MLVGDVWHRTREILREICMNEGIEILKGRVSKDHIHVSRHIAASDDKPAGAEVERKEFLQITTRV